jgi:hypothetical protein
MELKKAKALVGEMLDICNQLEDETLTEACSGIYNDVQASKTVEVVVSCARELMVFVNEAPWEEYDLSDLKEEVEIIFNSLLEEFEDF